LATILIGLLLAGAISYADTVRNSAIPALSPGTPYGNEKNSRMAESPHKNSTLGPYLKENKQ